MKNACDFYTKKQERLSESPAPPFPPTQDVTTRTCRLSTAFPVNAPNRATVYRGRNAV